MSYVQMSDLGRRGGWRGGRGRWRGRGRGRGWGGGYWGGGYYPWWDVYPIVEVDQVGPDFQSEDERIKRLVAQVLREELSKQRKPDMGQFYIDPLGPGAREGDIDRIARDDELVDEAIPAREALLMRQQAGLVGLGDTTGSAAPGRGSRLMTGATVALGAATGWVVGSWILEKLKARKTA